MKHVIKFPVLLEERSHTKIGPIFKIKDDIEKFNNIGSAGRRYYMYTLAIKHSRIKVCPATQVVLTSFDLDLDFDFFKLTKDTQIP